MSNFVIQPSRALFAAAMIGLGITGIVNGDFALVWQQIPVQHLPGRQAIAYLCATIELVLGLGLLSRRTLGYASGLLFVYLALWVILLEIPEIATAPKVIGAWGSFGEIAIMCAGAWSLFAQYTESHATKYFGWLTGANGVRLARLLLIICLPMIGLEVIIDMATAAQPIYPPWIAWLPFSSGWVYLSGAGSLLAFAGLLFGVFPRFAASLEAAMLGVVTVYFWGPYLHTGRTAITAFLISALIATGVWLVADTYRNVGWFGVGQPFWRYQKTLDSSRMEGKQAHPEAMTGVKIN